MKNLVRWQFTKSGATPYKTQVEILKNNLIPLVENESFNNKKHSFYITRMWGTDVRLAVFVEPNNLDSVRNAVREHTNELVLHPKDFNEASGVWKNEDNDWNGKEIQNPYNGCAEYFHTTYLEDIAWIGISSHKNDLADAIRSAIRAKFQTVPFGNVDPRTVLHSYFQVISERYRRKNEAELDQFWEECGFCSTVSSALGDHFYYNIILGKDWFNPSRRLESNKSQQMIIQETQKALNEHGLGGNS